MKVKLIIWDLDDTLWHGTLAEGDELVLDEDRVDIIRELNGHGIVNAICSKNDFEMGKQQLIQLGLWDLFVFPKISFAPKGPIVRQILDEMHLRAENTVFVDDNKMNLREVEHYVPGIHCFDALDESTTPALQKILDANKHVQKSRVEEYRILESKVAKSAEFSDNQAFLNSCNIRVSRVFGVDNLPFVNRIEELINRTNQLNFTMNRVQEGSMALEIADNALNETWSLFAWDDYGDYGLIGFAMVRKKQLVHFLFSCRTMNMGIEGHIMHLLANKFPTINPLVEPLEANHITMVNPTSAEGAAAIARMRAEQAEAPNLAIMANCQGGVISHYMGVSSSAHIEQWPTITTLQKEASSTNPTIPPSVETVVVGLFNDYDDRYWDAPPSEEAFSSNLSSLLSRLSETQVALVIPSGQLQPSSYTGEQGITIERVRAFNEIARSFESDAVRVYDLDEFLTADERNSLHDSRHYPREVWKKVGEGLRKDLT